MSKETINGVHVDIQKLADGLVQTIKEHPDGDCFRLGMFPNQIMQAWDKNLKKKIPDLYLDKNSGEIYKGKDTRAEITRLVCARALQDPMVIV